MTKPLVTLTIGQSPRSDILPLLRQHLHRIGLQQRLGVPVLLSNQLVARLAAELLP